MFWTFVTGYLHRCLKRGNTLVYTAPLGPIGITVMLHGVMTNELVLFKWYYLHF